VKAWNRCGILPFLTIVLYIIDQGKLLWKKLFTIDNIILSTLARMTLNRFKAVGSVYGVQSPTQSVSQIKSAIWQTFVSSLQFLWFTFFLCLLRFSIHLYMRAFIFYFYFAVLCYPCGVVMNEWMNEWMNEYTVCFRRRQWRLAAARQRTQQSELSSLHGCWRSFCWPSVVFFGNIRHCFHRVGLAVSRWHTVIIYTCSDTLKTTNIMNGEWRYRACN